MFSSNRPGQGLELGLGGLMLERGATGPGEGRPLFVAGCMEAGGSAERVAAPEAIGAHVCFGDKARVTARHRAKR
jgi:hypothetical protein